MIEKEAKIEEVVNDIVNQLELSTHLLPSTDNITEMAANRGNLNDFSEGQSFENQSILL